MARLYQLICMILCSVPVVLSVASAGDGTCPMTVTTVQGGSNVAVGDVPMKGDTITTDEDGTLELTLGDGAALKLGPGSALYVDVAYCPDASTQSVRLKLVTGSLWAKGHTSVPKFEVSTAHYLARVGTSTIAIRAQYLDTMFTMDLESQKVETRDWTDTVNVLSHTFPFQGDVSMLYSLAGNTMLIPWGGRGMMLKQGQQVVYGYKDFHISNKPGPIEESAVPFDTDGTYRLGT